MSLRKISKWIEAHAEEMVQLQTELTAIPALGPENGGTGEWARARLLEEYLRSHGLDDIDHYDCPDPRVPEGSRPNFAVSLPDPQDGPALWLLTHMDIVPPGERLPDGSWKGWAGDPYTLRRADDLLIGRGVVDNQQSLVGAVFAARALLETGVAPARPVRLLFVSDEETGSRYGLGYVVHTADELFHTDDLIVVPDWGNPEGDQVEIAEKSLLWFECSVTGRQAHASQPGRAVNAFRAAAELVFLIDRALHMRFDRVDHLYDTPASSFEPTRHGANVPNINTIPGNETFAFDCRVLPCYELDAVLACVEVECRRADAIHKTETRLIVQARQDAPPPTSADSEVVRRLQTAVEAVHGFKSKPVGTGGMSVASPLRARGLQVACYGTTLNTAHGPEESCSIAAMVADARIFAHMMAT